MISSVHAMGLDSAKTFWVVRGGSQGELDSMFLKENRIAIGWPGMGNLTELAPTREAFKAKYVAAGHNDPPGAIPVNAGTLYRFAVEMQVGDAVVYPSKIDRQFHIGVVTGSYEYAPERNSHYCNSRTVKWHRTVSKTIFSQGALNELNSTLTVFQVKNYLDEVRMAALGKAPEVQVEDDPTVSDVAESTEQTTKDFVLKRLARELKGYPLQGFIAQLLETMGYRTRVQGKGSDGGIDIIAHRDELGFEPPIIKVQVKATEGGTGDPEVSSLYGKVSQGEFGLFITLGTFTPKARQFGVSKHNLRLIDGEELVELILEHYEQFDSRYKGILPLKRVYVPEQVS